MPVRKDPDGRRWSQSEADVNATPEEVWHAIATGPGFSSWFVPGEVEEREGGKVVLHFAPGNSMDSVSTITAWDPPHRYVAESNDYGPDGPTVATEWTVEAKNGGICTVRVVHSWFAETDDWDGQFEQTEHGWVVFFRILALYLRDFAGQPPATFQMMGVASEPAADAWASLAEALGLTGVEAGQTFQTTEGAPPLAGTAERVNVGEYNELLLRLTAPGEGIAHLFSLPMAGQVYLPIRVFLFGPDAATVAAQLEPAWQAWMAERFAPVADADATSAAASGSETAPATS